MRSTLEDQDYIRLNSGLRITMRLCINYINCDLDVDYNNISASQLSNGHGLMPNSNNRLKKTPTMQLSHRNKVYSRQLFLDAYLGLLTLILGLEYSS